MATIDVLLPGIPGRTDQGYLGQSSVSLVDGTTVVDVGGLARRPMLEAAFEAVDVAPEDVESVLLTHLHFDHVQNVDLFENAMVYAPADEVARVERGEFDWATPRSVAALLDSVDLVRFEVGDRPAGLEAVHTPGHVEHHYSFVLEDGSLTYGLTGDAIKNVREFVTDDPFALYDDEIARATQRALGERLDVVVPGHDTPFLIDEDGTVDPCGDVSLTVGLHLSGDAGTHVTVESDRRSTVPCPPGVSMVDVTQSL